MQVDRNPLMIEDDVNAWILCPNKSFRQWAPNNDQQNTSEWHTSISFNYRGGGHKLQSWNFLGIRSPQIVSTPLRSLTRSCFPASHRNESTNNYNQRLLPHVPQNLSDDEAKLVERRTHLLRNHIWLLTNCVLNLVHGSPPPSITFTVIPHNNTFSTSKAPRALYF